ncbi:MAG: hypothetical protein V4736_10400 [Bdellovibrionota bacterium]
MKVIRNLLLLAVMAVGLAASANLGSVPGCSAMDPSGLFANTASVSAVNGQSANPTQVAR